jgi:hypothetical protein
MAMAGQRDEMALGRTSAGISPTGKSAGGPAICLSSPICKNISLHGLVETALSIPLSRPTEGRFAIVTNAGRDAVDADGAGDERRLRWTAKSCGPDASTPASSWRSNSPATVTNKPDRRGEHEVTVKTIACGNAGGPVVTMLVCFFTFAREAAGALGTRHSPRPLFSGRKIPAQLGRNPRREIADS